MAHERLSRDKLFMGMAELLAQRSTCARGQVGCVIVRDRRVIATGYNGAPPGEKHCTEVGCDEVELYRKYDDAMHPGYPIFEPESQGCERAIHAEANALAWAARYGVATEGAAMYSTCGPCLRCAQLILSAGIEQLIFDTAYRLPEGYDLLRNSHWIRVMRKSNGDIWQPRVIDREPSTEAYVPPKSHGSQRQDTQP